MLTLNNGSAVERWNPDTYVFYMSGFAQLHAAERLGGPDCRGYIDVRPNGPHPPPPAEDVFLIGSFDRPAGVFARKTYSSSVPDCDQPGSTD